MYRFGEGIGKWRTRMLHWMKVKIYRIWKGHIKVNYIKAPVGSDDYLFCDLFRGCCERNQECIRHHFQYPGMDQSNVLWVW